MGNRHDQQLRPWLFPTPQATQQNGSASRPIGPSEVAFRPFPHHGRAAVLEDLQESTLDRIANQLPCHAHLQQLRLLRRNYRYACADILEQNPKTSQDDYSIWQCCAQWRDQEGRQGVGRRRRHGLHLLDLYAEFVGGSAELHESFKTLHRRVKVEVETAQVACQTNGMLESLTVGLL